MDNSKETYERMQKYISNTHIPPRYDMTVDEWRILVDISQIDINELFGAIQVAFCYGFEKGCRCTRKAVAANV